MNYLNELHKRSVQFNERCGNKIDVTVKDDAFWEALKNQVLCLKEEVNELSDAIDERDQLGILDGAVDVAVVNSGVINLLEIVGFDVDLAMEKICDNNDSKYTGSREEVSDWNETLSLRGDNQQYYISSYFDEDVYDEFYCIRRASDTKIMKHPFFVPVSLTNCLPEESQ